MNEKIMNSKFMGTLQKWAAYIQKNDILMSITSGFQATLPLLIIGAVSQLVANFPIEAWKTFVADHGLKAILMMPNQMTMGVLALYATFFIVQKLAKKKGNDPAQVGVMAMVGLLILNGTVTLENVTALDFGYLGAKGLFTGIFVALLTNAIFSFFKKHKLYIRLPEEVPDQVSTVFASLLQAIASTIVFAVIAGIFAKTEYQTINALIYKFLQTPIQNIAGSYPGLMVFVFVSQLLWFFGIHGTQVTGAIWKPIYIAMGAENLAALSAGVSIWELPNILNMTFWGAFITLGGAGCAVGLNMLMAFRAKSTQLKTIGRVSLPTSLLNINEPLLFGTPIIMNPVMAIPFIFTPLINATVAYFLTYAHIIPRMNGVQPVLGIPIIVRGILGGSWIFGIVCVALLVLDTLIYYPFFKAMDHQMVKEEEENKNEQ